MASSLITALIPSLDDVVVEYLDGYLEEDEDPVSSFVRPLLECEGIDSHQIDELCDKLNRNIANKRGLTKLNQDGPKTLDQVLIIILLTLLKNIRLIIRVSS